ncbi:hypothetical protein [Aquitalea pelogenes]|uniref:hypothetical protein n=1 Tax=Aquitalea pelogenes TaxID=1293573 RepID=UPI0035B1482A
MKRYFAKVTLNGEYQVLNASQVGFAMSFIMGFMTDGEGTVEEEQLDGEDYLKVTIQNQVSHVAPTIEAVKSFLKYLIRTTKTPFRFVLTEKN